jgi:hypothetical protein
VKFVISLAMRLPLRSSSRWIDESAGTASTQRVGRRLTLEYTKSATIVSSTPVLDDPVLASHASVERTVGDVARHLLRAHQSAADLGVVDRRKIAAVAAGDLPASLAKQLDRRLLEASLRKAQLQHALAVHFLAP